MILGRQHLACHGRGRLHDQPADLAFELREHRGAVALNPLLIGGMRITVGSSVYDGSVRGRLNALERTL